MAVFKITSMIKNKRTGRPMKLMSEYIDTSKHGLLGNVNSKSKLKKLYESMQNINPISNERFKVMNIDRTSVLSRGSRWGQRIYRLNQVV
jgi:hypothetical protein